MKKEEIKINIKTEHIQGLLEGKKLVLQSTNHPTIVLIPDRYGVFMTMDKFAELRRKIAMQVIADPDSIFKEALGEDLFEKVFKV